MYSIAKAHHEMYQKVIAAMFSIEENNFTSHFRNM